MVVPKSVGIVALVVLSAVFSGCVSESGALRPAPVSVDSALQYCVEAADLGCAWHACAIVEGEEGEIARCVYDVCKEISEANARDCSRERCQAGVSGERLERFESDLTLDTGHFEFAVAEMYVCAKLSVEVEWVVRPGPGSYELAVYDENGTEVAFCYRGQSIVYMPGLSNPGCGRSIPPGGPYRLVWEYPGLTFVNADLIAIVDAPQPVP